VKTEVVIITGATGTGKSAFAERLALDYNGVILNGDMGQMYTPLSIGTAKPAWKTSAIPHYLFDILNEPRNSSSLEFRSQVERVLDELPSDRLPILVGGSLFHLTTLFYKPQGPRVSCVPEAPDSRACSDNQEDTCRNKTWEMLYAIDPHRAALLHPHDTYRISRALAIAQHTLPSQCTPLFLPVTPRSLIIHVTQPRDILYNRINARVHEMLDNGWIDEVKGLTVPWHSWLLAKKIIGYDTIIHERTRNYAKRQLTFWRSFSEKIGQEKGISLASYDGSVEGGYENFVKTLHIP
jgi:tRNA dimethylallyltransferase